MMEPHKHALSFMTKTLQTTDGSFTLATPIAGQAEPPPKGTAPPSAQPKRSRRPPSRLAPRPSPSPRDSRAAMPDRIIDQLSHQKRGIPPSNRVRRAAHPYDPDVAVRIICWFPANDQIVLALVGFDKKSIGDVFYASAAARGEAIVDAWLRQKGTSHD